MQNIRVLRAGHAAALGLGVLDIVQDLPGDPLAGGQDGDARRVAHDELAADHAHGLAQGQALFGRIEGLLRAGGHHGVDVFLAEQAGAVGAVAALDLGQCADQPLHFLRAVADGEVGQDVADVAELDLDVVLIAEDIIDLDARQADVQRVDAELGGVEVEDRVAVAQLLAEGVVAAHRVDLLAGILGDVGHLVEDLPPPLGQIAAGDVQTGHEQVAAGGGLGQVDDLPHIARVHIGADEQQARLGQAAAALVHRNGGHVGPCGHGRDRQPAAKVEVGAVGFVRQAEHPGVMGHLDDGAQVAADAVVGGVYRLAMVSILILRM